MRPLGVDGIGEPLYSVEIEASQYDYMPFDLHDVDADGWDDLVINERLLGLAAEVYLRRLGPERFGEPIQVGYGGSGNVVVLGASDQSPTRLISPLGAIGIAPCD